MMHFLKPVSECVEDVPERETLAQQSGVSESSIVRFERDGSITLESMILLATALDELTPFMSLFKPSQPGSVEELKNLKRKRGTR